MRKLKENAEAFIFISLRGSKGYIELPHEIKNIEGKKKNTKNIEGKKKDTMNSEGKRRIL